MLNRYIIFFNCGAVRYSRSDRTYKYEVRSIKEITNRIIPHFENYPLQGDKQQNFKRFKIICHLVHSNQHRNKEKLALIIEQAYSMNPSGKRKHEKQDLLKILDKSKV